MKKRTSWLESVTVCKRSLHFAFLESSQRWPQGRKEGVLHSWKGFPLQPVQRVRERLIKEPGDIKCIWALGR